MYDKMSMVRTTQITIVFIPSVQKSRDLYKCYMVPLLHCKPTWSTVNFLGIRFFLKLLMTCTRGIKLEPYKRETHRGKPHVYVLMIH